MKQIILVAMTLLTYFEANAQADWLLGYEIEMDVKLQTIEYGDMSTYVHFEVDKDKVIVIDFWTFDPLEGSIKTNIDDFVETEYGKKFKIVLKYKAIKAVEYRGFEEGVVETGEMVNEWVLVKINSID